MNELGVRFTKQMNGIPEGFNLSPLIGSKIERVDLGIWIMHFNFSNGWIIDCEGTVSLSYGTKELVIYSREWKDLNTLKDVIGADVISWSVNDRYSFSIALQNGSRLTFKDDSDKYESFQILPEGWII